MPWGEKLWCWWTGLQPTWGHIWFLHFSKKFRILQILQIRTKKVKYLLSVSIPISITDYGLGSTIYLFGVHYYQHFGCSYFWFFLQAKCLVKPSACLRPVGLCDCVSQILQCSQTSQTSVTALISNVEALWSAGFQKHCKVWFNLTNSYWSSSAMIIWRQEHSRERVCVGLCA